MPQGWGAGDLSLAWRLRAFLQGHGNGSVGVGLRRTQRLESGIWRGAGDPHPYFALPRPSPTYSTP